MKRTRLKNIGLIYNGLSGKRKSDFEVACNAYYITFLSVLENIVLSAKPYSPRIC